jgi:hypothetical protein
VAEHEIERQQLASRPSTREEYKTQREKQTPKKTCTPPTLAEWPLDQVANQEAKKSKRRQIPETNWDQPLCTQPNPCAERKKGRASDQEPSAAKTNSHRAKYEHKWKTGKNQRSDRNINPQIQIRIEIKRGEQHSTHMIQKLEGIKREAQVRSNKIFIANQTQFIQPRSSPPPSLV